MAAETIFGKILESATKHGPDTTASTTNELQANFMSGIADYLEKYVTFSGSFTGSNGTSTLTTPITSQVLANELRTTILSGANGFGSWAKTFYDALKTMPTLKPGTFIPSGIIPCFPSITMGWTQENLRNTAGNNGEDAHGKCMDMIGKEIIKDMKIGFVTTVPGAVGAYVGALSVSNITCQN